MEEFNESDYQYSIRFSLENYYFKKKRIFEIIFESTWEIFHKDAIYTVVSNANSN